MRTWEIASSDMTRTYRVEERHDTKFGGTYLYCPCPGWTFQKGKGQDCRHVIEARARMQMAEGGELHRPTPPTARAERAARVGPPTVEVRDLHATALCGIPYAHSREDHEAMNTLMGWTS